MDSKRKLIKFLTAIPIFTSSFPIFSWASSKNNFEDPILPENLGAVGNGTSDDSNPILTAIELARKTERPILLSKKYLINKVIKIDNNIHIRAKKGTYPELIFNLPDHPKFFTCVYISGKSNKLENIKINYQAPTSGGINNISVFGVFLDSKSNNNLILNTEIDASLQGKSGWSHCIRVMGKSNTISHCKILNGTMGISLRGSNLNIIGNYVTNNFNSRFKGSWNDKLPFWDGIVMEGVSKVIVSENIVSDCGQSGIYCGGNQSVSTGISISNNKVSGNWNRGIDIGVSGDISENNDVRNVLIFDNHSFNNRMPQIWAKNVSNISIINNEVGVSNDFGKLYNSSKKPQGIVLRGIRGSKILSKNKIYPSDNFLHNEF